MWCVNKVAEVLNARNRVSTQPEFISLGDYVEGVTPVPIPNTVVKPF
jgi:hypothetical protein